MTSEIGELTVVSSRDGMGQRCYLQRPAQAVARPPLVVSLHTWSFDVEQRNDPLEELVAARGWLLLRPDFRGPNRTPAACGSELARWDVLDAVATVLATTNADPRRVYLTGGSGGGHLTMLLAARHPGRWRAASAWVGISDLAAWHQIHAADEYGADLRAACGGAPGDSATVAAAYRDRSPLTWLHQAVGLPLDLAAGRHDGHTGSVPIAHTLLAFNRLAAAAGARPVSPAEIAQLSRPDGQLDDPQVGDLTADPTFEGRALYLRRHAGAARVSIFEGGHEGLATAAVAWFARHGGEE
ncbi:MAG: prolyl oligopeptidase family serine peptidase [Fimbriimonadaceae bacterium]|nr:prolyl oligopeptidase family serine peptidase [Fimbriimonadaceae bacterium]